MRISRFLAIAAASAFALACGDSTSPGDADTTPVTFNLCSGFGSSGWFAYQNEGGAWTQINANSSGNLQFEATERVSVAIVFSFFGSSLTQVINTTAAEINESAIVGSECDAPFGSRTMNGTVAGVTGDQVARLSAATSATEVDAFFPSWTLEDLPTTAVDLVATRYATFSTQPANRVFVRRGVVAPNGAVPVVDFTGSESAAPENATLTLQSVPSSGSIFVSTAVQTANGTLHDLGELSTGGVLSPTEQFNYISLPASLRIASDQHILTAVALDADGSRSTTHYYKTPSSKTMTLGPMVPAPTVSNAATSPYVRPRLQVASQGEYGGAVVAQWSDSDSETASRLVGVVTTIGYLGGALPSTWTVEVPDMSSAGYNASWGLQSTSYVWNLTVYNTTALTAVPVDGTTILSATRASDGSTIFARRRPLALAPARGR